MEDKTYIVYMHENKVNHKKYMLRKSLTTILKRSRAQAIGARNGEAPKRSVI